MSQCGCCGDSPLSITGNVVGILTFFVASFATWIAYVTLTLDATEEIELFATDTFHTQRQLAPLATFCARAHSENPDFQNNAPALHHGLEEVRRLLDALAKDLGELPQFDEKSRMPVSLQVRRRVAWLYRRRSMVERMDRISRIKQDLIVGQLNILLW
jgi:hypothetical protein